jgi:hypothetical protein
MSDDPYPGLVPIRQGGLIVWAERRPTHCPADHLFEPYKVVVSWWACRWPYPAVGHRTWTCLHEVAGHECGLIIYRPPHRP